MALTFAQRTGNDPSVFAGDRLYDYEKQLRMAPNLGYTREMMDHAIKKWSEIPEGGKGFFTSMDRNVSNFWRTRSPVYWAKQMAEEGKPIGTNPKFEEYLDKASANNLDVSGIPSLEQRTNEAKFGPDYYQAASAQQGGPAPAPSSPDALADVGDPFDPDYNPQSGYGSGIIWGKAEYIDKSELPDVYRTGTPGISQGNQPDFQQLNWADGYYYGIDDQGNAFRQEIGSKPGTNQGTWQQSGALPGGGDISGLADWKPVDNSQVTPPTPPPDAFQPPATSMPPATSQPPAASQPPVGGQTPDPFQPSGGQPPAYTPPNYSSSSQGPVSGQTAINSFLPGSRNDPFYTNQFNQLQGQNVQFQNQQSQANAMRQQAQQQPSVGMPKDPFEWMASPLPDVEVNDSGYANPFPGYKPANAQPTVPTFQYPGGTSPIFGSGNILPGGNMTAPTFKT